MEYYSRQILLWGEERQRKLKDKKVLIVGAGGLGCSIAIALSGVGIGEIDIVDFDRVEIHNIHRQIIFTPEDIGEYKSKIVSNFIKKRNPYIKSRYFVKPFEELDSEKLNYDLIIDATDNLTTRREIDRVSKLRGKSWIYGSVEEFNGQVCLFKDALFEDIFVVEKSLSPKGISAPMVMQIASFEANLAIRYLLNLSVASDIFYYLYYNNGGEFEIKKFKLQTKDNI
jgi:adenylyltransferase/sulfurtransferase